MRGPPATRARSRRGMTLIEVMVAMAIVGIILSSVFGVLLVNQRQVTTHAQTAALQSNLRVAALELESSLSRAGYGLDPNYALETQVLDSDSAAVAGTERDGTGPFGSDSLVVRFRDPLVARLISAASASQLTLASELPAGETLLPGQGLLLLCDGASDAAYVTVASYAPTTRVVSLATDGPFPFTQQASLSGACFSAGSAWMTRIERREYFIHWFDDPLQGGLPRPALMVRRGVDLDGNGTVDEAPTATRTADAELVALDIEQLQVAYVANRPSSDLATQYQITRGPDEDGDYVYGEAGTEAPDLPSVSAPAWPGASEAPGTLAPPLLSEANCEANVAPETTCSLGGKRRYTGHPGNLRTVRFSLVARSGRPEPALEPTRIDLAADGPLENLAADDLTLAPTRHRRQRYQGTVSLRNIFHRRHFVPQVGAGANVAGG